MYSWCFVQLQLREYTRYELIETGQVDYAHGLTAPMLEYLEIHFNHEYLPDKLGKAYVFN